MKKFMLTVIFSAGLFISIMPTAIVAYSGQCKAAWEQPLKANTAKDSCTVKRILDNEPDQSCTLIGMHCSGWGHDAINKYGNEYTIGLPALQDGLYHCGDDLKVFPCSN